MNIEHLEVKMNGEHSRNVHYNLPIAMQCHSKYSRSNQGVAQHNLFIQGHLLEVKQLVDQSISLLTE